MYMYLCKEKFFWNSSVNKTDKLPLDTDCTCTRTLIILHKAKVTKVQHIIIVIIQIYRLLKDAKTYKSNWSPFFLKY